MDNMDADCASPTSCAQSQRTKSPDEWHHIADSTQRKKVQNRNAQRIYRHKLKRRIAELEKINSKLVARQVTCSPQPEDSPPEDGPAPVRAEAAPALVHSSSASSRSTSEPAELPHTSDNNNNNNGYPLVSAPLLPQNSPFSLCGDDVTYSPQALWPNPNDSPLPPALDPLLQIPSFSLDFPVDMGAPCSYEPFTTLAATTSSPAYAPMTMEDVFAHDVCGASPPLPHVAGARDNVNAHAQLSGATPLHLAAAGGHQRAVAVLLGFAGAEHTDSNTPLSDPNALDASLQTPLHLAAAAGCEPVVQMLLDAGAHVRSTAANGWTPLHVAGCAGHDGVVKLLLRRGAEIDCRVTSS